MAAIRSKRFQELAGQLQKVEATKRREQLQYDERPCDRVDEELLLNWAVKAKSLLANACGLESQHFVHFADAEKGSMYSTNADNLKKMKAVFLAAQEDFDGGYISSVRNLVQAEVFGSELEQASELFKNGHALAAAVVAGVVLETTIRDLCTRNQITHGKLDRMNADLAKAGTYNTIVQKRVTHLAAVRNCAAHGNDTEFRTYDLRAMIDALPSLASESLKGTRIQVRQCRGR
jgi:hypothetical protein